MSVLRRSSADQLNKIVDQIHKEIGKDIGEETANIGANCAKLVSIQNPINKKIDTYDEYIKHDNSLQTRAFKSKYVNRSLVKKDKKLKESFELFLEDRLEKCESRFCYFNDKLILAGNSKYPLGTQIKFKDNDKELTGLLTHPFGFGNGDVGVYVDQKGIYTDDKCNLKNDEYIVDDPAAEMEIIKNDAEKFGLKSF